MSLSSSPLLCSSYDRFPEWECPLPLLEKKGVELAANDGEAAKHFRKKMDKRVKKDPEITCLTKVEATIPIFENMVGHHVPYDYNRLLPKWNPQIYLNVSMAHTPEQELLLAGCPNIPEQVTELFMHFLEGSASKRVWVSLLDSSEKPNVCNNFWRPDFVKRLPLCGEWRIIEGFSEELAKGENLSYKGTETTLVKTTLVFSNGLENKTFNHLHYTGWFDQCPCPDGNLFLRLLDEMAALNTQPNDHPSPKEVPIGINCIGGIGRTGMVAVGYIAYLKMLNCPKDKLATMTLNIPEIIYSLRKQRASLARNPEHLISLHSFLGKYYERLQRQST